MADRGEYKVELTPSLPPAMPSLGPGGPTSFKVNYPGGVQIGASPQQSPTSDCRVIINNLLPSITIMLGPLGFLFCVLNVVMKIIDCVKAVPDCITQLSPTPLTDALKYLALAVICLAKLIPQISMLYMISDILKIIIAFFDCLISALASLQAIYRQLAEAVNSAGKDTGLKTQLASAQAQTDVMVSQTITMTNPLVPLFDVLNLFLPLFGASKIDFTVPDPQHMPLDVIITTFSQIRETLAQVKTLLDSIISGGS
jgi:hypothetical protein